MAGIHILPILPGDARDAAVVNANWDQIADAVPIDAPNFAEEGLDYRALSVHPVGIRTGLVTESNRDSALATSASYVQFAQSGTTFRLTAPGGVPASLDADQHLRIRARVWLETTLAAGLGFVGTFGLQLVWHDGTSGAVITATTQELATATTPHAVLFLEGWLRGPITTINWVELRYKSTGGGADANPSKSMLWATRLRRTNEQ